MKRLLPLAALVALSACRAPPAERTSPPHFGREVYAWLCAAQQPSGFIAPEGRDFESVYANAVAAMAYTLKGDTARASGIAGCVPAGPVDKKRVTNSPVSRQCL